MLRPEEPLIGALERLSASEVSRGLVLEDGRLVGLLSITDLIRALELGTATRRAARSAP